MLLAKERNAVDNWIGHPPPSAVKDDALQLSCAPVRGIQKRSCGTVSTYLSNAEEELGARECEALKDRPAVGGRKVCGRQARTPAPEHVRCYRARQALSIRPQPEGVGRCEQRRRL